MEKNEEIPVQNTYRNAREAFRAKPFAAGYAPGTEAADRKTVLFLPAEGKPARGKDFGRTLLWRGRRVRHVKFGEGTVLAIKEGGRDYEVTVEFDGAGTRKMFAMFAKLAKI